MGRPGGCRSILKTRFAFSLYGVARLCLDKRPSMTVPVHFFRQSAVLASRENRILLVSTSKGNWTIPKGVVERNLTAAQSAAQEAFEEGGIRGTVREPSIGSFEYDKWGGTCRVEVFEME